MKNWAKHNAINNQEDEDGYTLHSENPMVHKKDKKPGAAAENKSTNGEDGLSKKQSRNTFHSVSGMVHNSAKNK